MFVQLQKDGLYFSKKELELEIKECGNIIFCSKEEIINSLSCFPGFKVTGCLSEKLKKEYLIDTKGTIYVVKLLDTRFCFCNSEGKAIYNIFVL